MALEWTQKGDTWSASVPDVQLNNAWVGGLWIEIVENVGYFEPFAWRASPNCADPEATLASGERDTLETAKQAATEALRVIALGILEAVGDDAIRRLLPFLRERPKVTP
jgi:hypothetical protein